MSTVDPMDSNTTGTTASGDLEQEYQVRDSSVDGLKHDLQFRDDFALWYDWYGDDGWYVFQGDPKNNQWTKVDELYTYTNLASKAGYLVGFGTVTIHNGVAIINRD